ncbi:hypothetical protein C0Q70_05936 [Pomacea canaliculata]|uniref:Uncharacterized protein n=2 Tax=Pomacea canaliculata TaxID=400727 RepID=A0A2T7PMM0_POMCA|nr:hypothetical protein C0Q70_05936 [Pomacea canaliculata]
MSHVSFLVIKGFVSDKYLCMNNVTTKLYASVTLNESCYLNESTRSNNLVFFFSHCRVGRKRCTLGMYRNGTMQLGRDARQSRETAQWLSKPVGEKVLDEARIKKEEIEKNGWKPRRREQQRKRARRWCVQLDVMVQRPDKYLKRCKGDCQLLEKMLNNSQFYMRRCLQRMVRRRRKMKALKSPTPLPTWSRNNCGRE